MLPDQLIDNDVTFHLGDTAAGVPQAVKCRGQTISFGDAHGNEIHLLAAATQNAVGTFGAGDMPHEIRVQSWTGFIGQWYDRVWDRDFAKVDHKCDGRVRAILPGWIERGPIAWFSTHRHDPTLGNEPYRFTYLFHYVIPRPSRQVGTLTLPFDERICVFAASVADGARAFAAAPLYDDLSGGTPISVRHDYDQPTDAVFVGVTPSAEVRMDRERRFDLLEMGPPRGDDDIDASRSEGFVIRSHAPDGRFRVHPDSGALHDVLVRLNDGRVAHNDDDTDRCVWYDNEGRFTLNLLAARHIDRINTYSWHRSNRAPQYFSLWGAVGEEMPTVGFARGEADGWELIAVVDTRELGDGDIHGTSIENPDGAIGPYRYLLWIAEDVGQGTFFTEIDIDFSGDSP
jgi:alpha-mannosidase